MVTRRFKLRTAAPKRVGDVAGWDLTFDPIDEEGDAVEIHLSDEAYESAVRVQPLERSAEDIEELRRMEATEKRPRDTNR